MPKSRDQLARFGHWMQLLLWILEAGVVSREELRLRGIKQLGDHWEDLPEARRRAFTQQLSRDLNKMMECHLIEAMVLRPDGVAEVVEVIPGGGLDRGEATRLRKNVFYRAKLRGDFLVISPDGPGLDPAHGPRIAAEFRRAHRERPEAGKQRAALMYALAEWQAAVAAGSPGRALLERVRPAVEARFGELSREPKVLYRPLPPKLGVKSREKVRPAVWAAIQDALHRGLRVTLQRKGRKDAPELADRCPHRVVWYNGQPRLEFYWSNTKVRCWHAIPLHHLASVKVQEGSRVKDALMGLPSREELDLVDNVWGADLEDKAFQERDEHDTRTLAELAEDVELVFRGPAANAILADPGSDQATLGGEHDASGQRVRYKVRTLVGRHFKKWLLSWGAEVQVIQPRWLAAELAELGQGIQQANQATLAAAVEEEGGG